MKVVLYTWIAATGVFFPKILLSLSSILLLIVAVLIAFFDNTSGLAKPIFLCIIAYAAGVGGGLWP